MRTASLNTAIKTWSMGTPKTLIQAIQNGVDDCDRTGKSKEESISDHVEDFIRQKLAVVMLADGGPFICKRLLKMLFNKTL